MGGQQPNRDCLTCSYNYVKLNPYKNKKSSDSPSLIESWLMQVAQPNRGTGERKKSAKHSPPGKHMVDLEGFPDNQNSANLPEL